jgi:16S rRNA (uracil1498-N3)-methyltransferase
MKGKPSAWLAIGPEGDFSAEEVQGLVQKGAAAVHLGELRLRTETAGMAAVAQFAALL